MSQEFPDLNKEEQLRAENDFLKMKLMLQHGAAFGGEEKNELPPEVENEFLNNVLSFEDQFAQGKRISVFDKIGKPDHFRPVSEIPDDEIDQCWEQLLGYLIEHGIHLLAFSPIISSRELYRFTTQELFKEETDDINIPGMITGYIYEEFYPPMP
jgi:hypothetical protein